MIINNIEKAGAFKRLDGGVRNVLVVMIVVGTLALVPSFSKEVELTQTERVKSQSTSLVLSGLVKRSSGSDTKMASATVLASRTSAVLKSNHRVAETDAKASRTNRQTINQQFAEDDAWLIIEGLLELLPRDGQLTLEDIAEINSIVERLKSLGSSAVPAIREYLESLEDIQFAKVGDGQPIEFPSLRLALIRSLAEIGGQSAMDTLVMVMEETSDLLEIRALAKGLEDNFSNAFREEINIAALEVLELALEGEFNDFAGIGHLMDLLKNYGDENAAQHLEKAFYEGEHVNWKMFSILALSELPDGGGVPELVNIINSPAVDNGVKIGPTSKAFLIRTLAQLSREYPEANDAFFDVVLSENVNTSSLVGIAKSLGGIEIYLHVQPNNLVVSKLNNKAPEQWSIAEIEDRLFLIHELLAMGFDPQVENALKEASNRLLVWKSIKLAQ